MKSPQANSALPPIVQIIPGLHLNAFRGEPAISVFDWHFTPPHSSSERFVTHTGAALHVRLGTLQPDHGELTRFRVYPPRPLIALFRRAFAAAPAINCLNQATGGNSPGHTPKGTPSGDKPPPTACRQTISGSISLPSPGCFSPFPHGTVRYRSRCVLSLGRWSAQLPTRFFVPGGTQEHTQQEKSVAYPAVTDYGDVFQTSSCHL